MCHSVCACCSSDGLYQVTRISKLSHYLMMYHDVRILCRVFQVESYAVKDLCQLPRGLFEQSKSVLFVS